MRLLAAKVVLALPGGLVPERLAQLGRQSVAELVEVVVVVVAVAEIVVG